MAQAMAYEELMQSEGITFDELPNEAKVGIKGIKKILNAINMTKQRGQKPTSETLAKLKTNDTWIVREILYYMEDKESDQGQIPNDPNEVIAEMGKNEISPEEQAKYNEGMNYETELENLAKSGKGTFTSDEIRSSAPKCYKLILSTYDETGPNGIGTSRYTLIEDQSTKQTFNLKRK